MRRRAPVQQMMAKMKAVTYQIVSATASKRGTKRGRSESRLSLVKAPSPQQPLSGCFFLPGTALFSNHSPAIFSFRWAVCITSQSRCLHSFDGLIVSSSYLEMDHEPAFTCRAIYFQRLSIPPGPLRACLSMPNPRPHHPTTTNHHLRLRKEMPDLVSPVARLLTCGVQGPCQCHS